MITVDAETLKRMIAQAVEAEREACAKVCDELPLVEGAKQVQRATLKDAAAAIRTRDQS